MKLRWNWKIVLSLAAVFVAGAVSGAVLTLRIVQKAERQMGGPLWVGTTLQRYQAKLQLTPEQIERLRPAIEQTGREFRDLRRDTLQGVVGIARQMDERVSPELTPEQKLIHDRMKHKALARLRERLNVKTSEGPESGSAPTN